MKAAMQPGLGVLLPLALLASHCFALAQSIEPVAQPLRALLQTIPSSEPTSGDCCALLAGIGFSSNLPVVVLESTSGQYIPHQVETNVTLCTCSNGANYTDYFGPAEAAGRGTSSANFTKKSYKIKTLGADGKSQDISFLGMPKDDDWILYGPELDKTMGMRNYLTYNLARASGHYATRTVYCEVFVVDDGKPLSLSHYNGIYIAEEKVKRGKNRVNMSKLAAPDLSGGYIFLYDNDNIEEGDLTFGPLPGWEHPFLLKDPNNFLQGDNGNWLLNYLKDFESALNAPDWLQRQVNLSYTSFIDGPAFTDFFLLVELTKSPDGYRGSTYMHKDKDKPFVMGPVWDYNEAYGMCCGYPIDGWQRGGQSGPGVSGGSAISPEGWRFNICADPGRCLVEPGDGTSRWFRQMWNDPRFRQAAATRWGELRAGPWSDGALKTLISDTTQRLSAAAGRNFAKFAEVLGVTEGVSGDSLWRGEVNDLQDWLLKHVAWIDGAIAAAAAAATAGGVSQAGK